MNDKVCWHPKVVEAGLSQLSRRSAYHFLPSTCLPPSSSPCEHAGCQLRSVRGRRTIPSLTYGLMVGAERHDGQPGMAHPDLPEQKVWETKSPGSNDLQK